MSTVQEWTALLTERAEHYVIKMSALRQVVDGDVGGVLRAFTWSLMPNERTLRWCRIYDRDVDMTEDERNLVLALYLKARREGL